MVTPRQVLSARGRRGPAAPGPGVPACVPLPRQREPGTGTVERGCVGQRVSMAVPAAAAAAASPAPLALWGTQARLWGAATFACAVAAARACARGTRPTPGPHGTASGTGMSPRSEKQRDADGLARQEEAAECSSGPARCRAPAPPEPSCRKGAAAAELELLPATARPRQDQPWYEAWRSCCPQPGAATGRGGGSGPDQHPWGGVSGCQGEPWLLPNCTMARGAAEPPSHGPSQTYL